MAAAQINKPMLQDLQLPVRSRRTIQQRAWLLGGVLFVVALMCVAYRTLPSRPFAADDFQWLIGARSLGFGAMLQSAFDPSQNHFYRPMVWVLFWLQARAFDLDPRGYHAVSLGLHLANALLLGGLVYRVANDQAARANEKVSLALAALVAPTAFVALHPAPFEAVTWVSAQSELLAAFWLLSAMHLWLSSTNEERQTKRLLSAFVFRLSSFFFLALALLTKESAVIGLPLLILLDLATTNQRPRTSQEDKKTRRLEGNGQQATDNSQRANSSRVTQYITRFWLPALITLVYLGLQLRVERENYVVDQGGYGLGWQLVANPLRSLGLVVAPLPGTEHANAPWLVPFGGVIAVLLLVWLIADRRLPSAISLAALTLTLLPTAPFVSPPDSRYLYLPVMAFAVVGTALCGWLVRRRAAKGRRRPGSPTTVHRPPSTAHILLAIVSILALAGYAAQETAAREQRFAVAAGSDGSLMSVATATCADRTPDRVILLSPPMAEQHARAVLGLACGDSITPIFVETMEIAEANLEPNSLIIDFPNGVARIAQHT